MRRLDEVNGKTNCSVAFKATTNLTAQHTDNKIYLFPPKLNKGTALKRLTEKFSVDKIFAAGDGEIDLPMLEVADVAFAPKNLRGKKFVTCSDAPNFAAEFLQRLNAAITSDSSKALAH